MRPSPYKRRRHNRSAPRKAYASIDLGTNNCRMLIARPINGGFKVVDSFSRITRLGQSIAHTNQLSDDAMDRTISALRQCQKKMNYYSIVGSRHVVTEACRRSTNADFFIQRVAEEIGLDLTIISPEEEATLALNGCHDLLNTTFSHILVFDIGGGSTEISWGRITENKRAELLGYISLPLGVVTVMEENRSNPAAMKDRLTSQMRESLQKFDAAHSISEKLKAGRVQAIGVSGTTTTLGALHLDLPRYDRRKVDGMTVPYDALDKLSQMIEKMPYKDCIAHPCIGKGRADLMPTGCAILDQIAEIWPFNQITIADRGLREGVLLNLMQDDPIFTGAT